MLTVKIATLTVWVQNLRGEPRWLHGIILEQTGPISY